MNDQSHPGMRAAFYCYLLRRRGYTVEQAAALVIERYPWARVQLGHLASRATWDTPPGDEEEHERRRRKG